MHVSLKTNSASPNSAKVFFSIISLGQHGASMWIIYDHLLKLAYSRRNHLLISAAYVLARNSERLTFQSRLKSRLPPIVHTLGAEVEQRKSQSIGLNRLFRALATNKASGPGGLPLGYR